MMMNMAMAMENADVRQQSQELLAKLEADPVINGLMEAAETIEDMYEIAKRYVTMKLEDFRQMFEEAMDYYKGTKVELDDDTMEYVVGGSWKSFWEGFKKVALVAVIAVGVGLACAATAGAAAAGIATVGAVVAGTAVGSAAVTGAVTGAIGGAAAGIYGTAKAAMK